MPGGDKTGPSGMGPMTGRAAGYCAGYPAPGFQNPVQGRGYGRGAGFGGGGGGGAGGRRWRNMYYATGLPGWARTSQAPAYSTPPAGYAPQLTADQELATLKAEAEQFTGALDNINKRIAELESSQAKK
jgi:Family of unknown function (DUF5320)